MDKTELLTYMRSHKLAVVGSIGPDAPQAALVGVATTDDFQLVFDTVSDSRKHINLAKNPHASATFSGPGEQTLQFEGIAHPVSMDGAADAKWRDVYYAAWPDGVERRKWPKLTYWRIAPTWLRYSDFGRGPLIEEMTFDGKTT
jgi:general stress protein 26